MLSSFRPRARCLALAATLTAALAGDPAAGAALIAPFDFSRAAIGLDVTVKGAPLYVMLDTGADPSIIDLGRADALGLKVDRRAGGEASGEGDAAHSQVFPTAIDGLVIQGRAFAPVSALAFDMTGLSTAYGRKLDGVLGYSFLTGRIVLIDYAKRQLGVLDRPAEAAAMTGSCRTRWSTPLKSFKGDTIPIIPRFRLGQARAPISLDTGSNGAIALYQGALDLPGVRAALVEKGEASFSGARGAAKAKAYVLNAPVGFGPFILPAGQAVVVHPEAGSRATRLANIGNTLFADMGLKLLLDYRHHRMTFYGGCS
jgi:hypothetical protein